jgi:hypothetical protein
MWLHLYPGKIEDDLCRLNEEGFRKKSRLEACHPTRMGCFYRNYLRSSTVESIGEGTMDV